MELPGWLKKSPRLGQLAERAVDVIEQWLAETPCQAITGKRQNIGQRGGSNGLQASMCFLVQDGDREGCDGLFQGVPSVVLRSVWNLTGCWRE